MLLRVPDTRKVMVRLKMPFVLLSVCSRSVEPLVSVNSKLSWIGAILRVRPCILAPRNELWATAVRLYCQLLELFVLTPEFSLINDARLRRYFSRGKRVLSP